MSPELEKPLRTQMEVLHDALEKGDRHVIAFMGHKGPSFLERDVAMTFRDAVEEIADKCPAAHVAVVRFNAKDGDSEKIENETLAKAVFAHFLRHRHLPCDLPDCPYMDENAPGWRERFAAECQAEADAQDDARFYARYGT